jgi:hypothetical protein
MNPCIEAAVAAASRYGVVPDRCDILQDGHTLVVRLNETLVVRVVTDIDGPRQGLDWFKRETAVAAHLTQHHAPVLEQCLIARAAVMSAWYPILYPAPSEERVGKLKQRIEWLRTKA